MSREREVILEFFQVGKFMKVSAFDPVSLTEVSIVGDPSRGQPALRDAAIRKLNYVLNRNAAKDQPARRAGQRQPGR